MPYGDGTQVGWQTLFFAGGNHEDAGIVGGLFQVHVVLRELLEAKHQVDRLFLEKWVRNHGEQPIVVFQPFAYV